MSIHPRLRSLVDRITTADLNDRAGALTYFSFLSLFPTLIIVVALTGLFGSYPETYEEMLETLRNAAPEPAVSMIDGALEDAVRNRGGAGGLLGIGLLITLYSASSAMGAAIRGIEAIYGRRHSGAWWHGFATRFALTIVVGLMAFVAFATILLAGPVFREISDLLGVSESVSTTVAIVRWPIGIASLITIAMLLYWVGCGRDRTLRHLFPGAVLAVLVVLVASLGFNVYVSNFESFGATYGSLGAVIVLLIWIWLSSLGLLIGAAVNAEIDHVPLPNELGEAPREAEPLPERETDPAGRR